MKVILLEDVKNVGKKDQVVDVADGYARNFLIRGHLAVQATKTSQGILDNQRLQEDLKEKQKFADAEALKAKLATVKLTFQVKAGADGKVFGSISSKQIAENLQKNYGISIDKRKIVDNGPINTLGLSIIKIDLHKNIVAEITIHLKAV
ncbi:MAG: 50S ribosomal protein L9 [Erysipelotrichales bacterium]|nr:MAG: 50S ribosomal protein L9 [Erysipelotrichales bacterium]